MKSPAPKTLQQAAGNYIVRFVEKYTVVHHKEVLAHYVWRFAKESRVSLLLFAGALLVFLLSPQLGIMRSSFSDAQLFAFPLFLAAVFYQPYVRLPLRNVLFVLILLLWAVVVTAYSRALTVDRGTLLLAVLLEDPIEVDSSLLRRRLDQEFERYAIPPTALLPRNIASSEDLPAEFASPIVWGTKRWLNVSLPADTNALSSNADFGSFTFVEDVPIFGLSWQPAPATSRFLASLVVARRALARSDFYEAESHLLAAAGAEAFWTSNAHRAYPLFLLGNLYARLAHDENFEPGYIHCAEGAYAAAVRFVGDGGNPELLAAILQNRAVLHVLAGEGRFEERALEARRYIRQAREFALQRGPWGRPASEYTLNAILENELVIRNLRMRERDGEGRRGRIERD